jgi:hypothetical protein
MATRPMVVFHFVQFSIATPVRTANTCAIEYLSEPRRSSRRLIPSPTALRLTFGLLLRVPTVTAAAPSDSVEAFPAVTLPPSRNAGAISPACLSSCRDGCPRRG